MFSDIVLQLWSSKDVNINGLKQNTSPLGSACQLHVMKFKENPMSAGDQFVT